MPLLSGPTCLDILTSRLQSCSHTQKSTEVLISTPNTWMAVRDVTSDWLRALLCPCVIIIIIIHLFVSGATGMACYTTLESVDLGCLLRWDCPHASPNTTFSVQTKTQGDPWRDVSWCVWVSAHTCDVSHVFSNFEAYSLVRVGVHLSTSATVWMQPRKFDSTDFTFSAPSLSLSLREDQLLVKVQFPCAANRRCSAQHCCPITELIDPLTTVTLYNKLSEYQSRTLWTLETMLFVEFSGLAAGQNYCAVANFSFSMASSPPSSAQCIQTSSHIGLLPLLYVGIALSLLLLVPLSGLFLRRPRRAPPPADSSPPKSPGRSPHPKPPVADPISLVPLSMMPADPGDIHIELSENVSLESSSSSSSSSSPGLPSRRSSPPGITTGGHHRAQSTPHTEETWGCCEN